MKTPDAIKQHFDGLQAELAIVAGARERAQNALVALREELIYREVLDVPTATDGLGLSFGRYEGNRDLIWWDARGPRPATTLGIFDRLSAASDIPAFLQRVTVKLQEAIRLAAVEAVP